MRKGMILSALLVAAFLVSRPLAGSQENPPHSNIPGDTVILAKLMQNLDLQKCAVNDQVEAQTTADVKQGKDVLLKKGSSLLGHIVSVQPPNSSQPESTVVIVFDGVKSKGGPTQSLPLVLRALAPESEAPAASTIAGGRGMPGEDTHAAMGGGDHAEQGGIARLNTSSQGVAGIPNLELGIRKSTTGQHMSLLSWSKGNVVLKKSTQMAFLVVGQ